MNFNDALVNELLLDCRSFASSWLRIWALKLLNLPRFYAMNTFSLLAMWLADGETGCVFFLMGVMICDGANLERLNGHAGYKNKCQIAVFVGLFHVIPRHKTKTCAGSWSMLCHSARHWNEALPFHNEGLEYRDWGVLLICESCVNLGSP